MAERKAIANGNWSNVNTWDGTTTLPGVGDIVYANGFTVTVDQDIDIGASGELRTTAGPTPIAGSVPVQGGVFNCASGPRQITGNIIAGSTTCVTASGGTYRLTHNGTVKGGSSVNARGIDLVGTGVTITQNGNVSSGNAASAFGVFNSAGTASGAGGHVFNGNLGTDTGSTAANGVNLLNCNDVAVNGNITSDSSISTSSGLSCGNNNWSDSRTLTINGNITGNGNGYAANFGAIMQRVTVNGKISANTSSGAQITGQTNELIINNPGQVAVEGSNNGAGSSDVGLLVGQVLLEVTINGHVKGGSAPSACYGITVNSTTNKITINGDVIGGSVAATNWGIFTNTATVPAGIIVNGSVIGGDAAGGLQVNNTTTPVIATCIQGNNFGNGTVNVQAAGVSNLTDNGLVRTKQLKSGTHGMAPVLGRVELIEDTPNNMLTFPRYSDMAMLTLRPTAFSADHPAPANVRHGTAYDSGQKTGTMRVPAAASVFSGVPVDNTVGTATVTADSIRAALGLANPNLDAQLAAAAVERNAILAAVVTTNDHTDTVEASIAALPKEIHNFDCGANQGDTVPSVSLRNFVRHVFNWSITDTTKTVYKEDGATPAYTSTVVITDGSVLGDNQT